MKFRSTATAPLTVSRDGGRPALGPRLAYHDVRAELADGDVVLFRGKVLLSRFVRSLTRGEYSHCGIVLKWSDRKMLVHADIFGGVHTIPLSKALSKPSHDAEWFSLRPELRGRLDLPALRDEAQAHLGLGYAFGQALLAGAHVLLGAPAPTKEAVPRTFFCSEYVSRCFRRAGVPLATRSDDLVSPTDIALSGIFEFRGTIASLGSSC